MHSRQLPGSITTPIFSKIRADVAKDFVGKFPEHFDFVGMLRRVSENSGVRVIKRPNYYRLEGQWSPIGQIYDTLSRTLDIYGTSDQYGVNTTKIKTRDTPTPRININSGAELHIPSNVMVCKEATVDVKDMDPDDDCDYENHEYNSLKNTISDICSSLGKEEEFASVKQHNDDISKVKDSLGEEEFKEVPVAKKYISFVGSNVDCFKTEFTLPSSNRRNNENKRSKSFSKKKKCKNNTHTSPNSKELLEENDKKAVSTEKCYIVVNEDMCEIVDPSHRGNNTQSRSQNDLKMYQCVECNFIHKSNTAIREHYSRMHRAKPTKCNVCQKLFPSERYAKRHCRLVHRDTQYCCDVCGKTYKILRTLEDHLKSHKDGYIKPDFPCGMCEKTFSSHYVLKCHIKSIHYGENRTYLCPVCGKSFTTKHSLNMHQNVHSGSRPFTCNICGKSFTYDSALRDHKFVHSGKKIFECEICKKAFQQRSGLQMHAKIHQEKKAYECKDCGRAFIQKQSLQRHERSHKGEKPFCCKVCGRSFGDSGIIRRHLIMVHKINKDTKSWREDIVEKGRKNPGEENHDSAEEDVVVDLGEDFDLRDTKTNESQKQNIIEQADNDTNQSSISQLKYQEGCVSDTAVQPSPDTGNLEALPPCPTNESPSPNMLQGTSDPTCLPDAQSFITIDYCRPLPLPPQLPPLGSNQGDNVASYSLHPHQHSPYLNPPTSSHMDPTRYHYPMACSQQTVGIVADARYTLTQTEPNNLSLPRVDNVLNKCLHDMEPPDNLSISSLYAYYTSLASQYLNASQYQGYGGADSITPDQE
ncbi:Zinc finger protein 829 [Mizuhopecten yessoensis]|uniref:Zinc finger protein 829 n=2 Tax=Mizuhopecten yessoensis TaxID=6573 RepID=A0A210QVX1_MIZYE|nr:Zinc finger protein 829 [Mizuhopecten yessoensis]